MAVIRVQVVQEALLWPWRLGRTVAASGPWQMSSREVGTDTVFVHHECALNNVDMFYSSMKAL
jgi:hypothetical protein